MRDRESRSPSGTPWANAMPALVVAMNGNPALASTMALPGSQALGRTINPAASWRSAKAVVFWRRLGIGGVYVSGEGVAGSNRLRQTSTRSRAASEGDALLGGGSEQGASREDHHLRRRRP